MLWRRRDMLELPQIPRDRGQLQALINEARAARRRGRLTRFAAGNCAAWALFVLFVWSPMQAASAGVPPTPPALAVVYIPIANR